MPKSAVREALYCVVRAAKGYVEHQPANQAASIAFAWLLAMFPLLAMPCLLGNCAHFSLMGW